MEPISLVMSLLHTPLSLLSTSVKKIHNILLFMPDESKAADPLRKLETTINNAVIEIKKVLEDIPALTSK